MKNLLLGKIRGNELSMRPRFHFTLKVVLLAVVAGGVLVTSVLLVNFIVFMIRTTGNDSLLGFGGQGILFFLAVFPWTLLAFAIVLVVLLESLLRKFRFGYRSPVLYLVLGIIAVSASAGFALDRATTFNDDLLGRAQMHRLPSPFMEVYEYAHHPQPRGSGICRCTIIAIEGDTLVLEDARTGTTTVLRVLLPRDNPRATTTSLSVGDVVFVAGEEIEEGILHAFGVHRVGPSAPARQQ